MFQKGRINIYNNEHKGQLSTALDKTLERVHALLKDKHRFTITDIWRDSRMLYTNIAREGTIVCALQQLQM